MKQYICTPIFHRVSLKTGFIYQAFQCWEINVFSSQFYWISHLFITFLFLWPENSVIQNDRWDLIEYRGTLTVNEIVCLAVFLSQLISLSQTNLSFCSMTNILDAIFWNEFCGMKIYVFQMKFVAENPVGVAWAMVKVMHLAFIWTNDETVYRRIYAALVINVLIVHITMTS